MGLKVISEMQIENTFAAQQFDFKAIYKRKYGNKWNNLNAPENLFTLNNINSRNLFCRTSGSGTDFD